MRRFESFVLRRADAVVAIHDRFKSYLAKSSGAQLDAIHVVRNWTHTKPIEVDPTNYRRLFGWGDETVILHAGNMGAKQALENVVEAARLADARNSPVRFVLLGNGNQRRHLGEVSAGIERLQFLDSLDDLDFQGALAASDILLVNEKPGVTEMAVPSKLTSYFAAKRPVIAATDSGSITAQEIDTARAGLRVNAGDPQALLEAALELGDDPARASAFGENGAIFQMRELSRETAISHYAEIINSLAEKRSR
jgi:glycosyltransferase involved in cell wall biosynthesis